MEPTSEERQRLEAMFFELAMLTEMLQHEISAVLIQNDQLREQTSKAMSRPDHEILEVVGKAVRQLVLVMPLASNYGVNVFAGILGMHSTITGDNTMETILDSVRKRILSIQHN